MAETCPPPRSRVWLGAFDPQGTYTVKTHARVLQSVPHPSGGNPVASHMTTLTIGSVLPQVFTTNFVLADVQSLPEYDADPPRPYGHALTRIWPEKQPVVHWPPTHYMDPYAFDKVVNWGPVNASLAQSSAGFLPGLFARLLHLLSRPTAPDGDPRHRTADS
jgi:hypothetical protein